jgi:hypothetical protein
MVRGIRVVIFSLLTVPLAVDSLTDEYSHLWSTFLRKMQQLGRRMDRTGTTRVTALSFLPEALLFFCIFTMWKYVGI